MKEKVITKDLLNEFRQHLKEDEKSEATIQKYMRDIRHFMDFADGRQIDKTLVLSYKADLGEEYAIASANSMIAALNAFLRYFEWYECCVKQYKVQKKAYCSEEEELTREEYVRLLETALENGNERLNLILQTICATGIRVSELEYITVESLQQGEAQVNCKGKIRRIFLVNDLRGKLLDYTSRKGLDSGPVFVTRGGKPVNRCNIWREMKNLCNLAGVAESKVYPHNLRHLFARSFYNIEKDIAKLADVLGHSNINTTRIYIMTTGAEHRKKMEQMDLIV